MLEDNCSDSPLLFNLSINYALESWSQNIMIYLYPLLDVTGKHPIWSLKNFMFSWTTLV